MNNLPITEKNVSLDKSDYLLALVPIIMFLYPITVIFLALFNFQLYFNYKDPIAAVFTITGCVLSLIGWNWKVKRLKKDFIFALVIFLADCILFFVIVYLFQSSLTVENSPLSNGWNLALGFLFIVITKISADFHKVTIVYNDLLKRFNKYFQNS